MDLESDAARACRSFTSVLDARAAMDQAFGEPDIVEEQDSLLLFMARCLALDVDTPGDDETNLPHEASDDLPDVDLGTRIDALRAFLARRSARPSPAEPERPIILLHRATRPTSSRRNCHPRRRQLRLLPCIRNVVALSESSAHLFLPAGRGVSGSPLRRS